MKFKKTEEKEITSKDINKMVNDGLLDDVIGRLIQKEEIKNTLIKDYEYINWLISFTLDNGTFWDDDYKYKEETLSDIDKENVSKLGIFYDAINDYADQNIIYPFPCGFGNFYQITYNNVGFEIGILAGQGIAFFCNRTATNPNFIDFNDIVKYGKKENKNIRTRKEKN